MDKRLLQANAPVRAELLGRIRAALGRAKRPPSPAPGPAAASPSDSPRGHGPRPTALATADHAALKERFVRFALASSTTLDEVDQLAAVPARVAAYLEHHGLPRRAAIWAELAHLDWAAAGLAVEARAARGDDAVGITGVFCALAETGTVLVLSGPDTAATTSLLPETHLAVVPLSRLVAGMEEAFALVLTERGSLPRALNFISGPSRTGDIEQTMVLGAHGPARVHLLLVNDAAG